ncbi:MAG: hypothetical protein HOE90_06585 [Bacteriovoracaceae bacterium]|nr:hypothetical protein [Bacteriovoracaceae bacterium]
MAKKVLIAAPSDIVNLATFLKEKSVGSQYAYSGKEVQLEISKGNFSALTVHENIAKHPLPMILNYIQSNCPELPTVVLSKDVDNKDICSLGVETYKNIRYINSASLSDPPEVIYGLLDLESALFSNAKATSDIVSDEEDISKDDVDFSKIAIKDFISGKVVQFDVFVMLSSGKYVKILHTGDSFTSDRIAKYAKKTDSLYILKSDREKYIEFSNYMLDKFADKQVHPSLKISLSKNSIEKFTESLFDEGINPKSIQKGKKICGSIHKLISADKSLYKSFNKLQNMDPNAYSISYLTAFFSSMIAFNCELKSASSIETMAMAAMLLDIGMTEIPDEISGKKAAEMTPEEHKVYETHPALGSQLVEKTNIISNTIPQIIMQHHEASDGSGFPRGLKDIRLQMLSKIVYMANFFAFFIVDRNLGPFDGLKKIISDPDLRDKFNQPILKNFIKIFIDPEKLASLETSHSQSNNVKSA